MVAEQWVLPLAVWQPTLRPWSARGDIDPATHDASPASVLCGIQQRSGAAFKVTKLRFRTVDRDASLTDAANAPLADCGNLTI